MTISVTPRWLLVNSKIEFPKFKIYGFCQHRQSNSRGLLIPLHAPCTTKHGLGVTAPNPLASRATANRPAPLHAGARVKRRGLRVGAVVSFGGSFVGGLLQLWIAHLAARPTRRGTMSGGNLTQSSIVRSQDARLGTLDHGDLVLGV